MQRIPSHPPETPARGRLSHPRRPSPGRPACLGVTPTISDLRSTPVSGSKRPEGVRTRTEKPNAVSPFRQGTCRGLTRPPWNVLEHFPEVVCKCRSRVGGGRKGRWSVYSAVAAERAGSGPGGAADPLGGAEGAGWSLCRAMPAIGVYDSPRATGSGHKARKDMPPGLLGLAGQ